MPIHTLSLSLCLAAPAAHAGVYENRDHGFVVRFPDGWDKKEVAGKGYFRVTFVGGTGTMSVAVKTPQEYHRTIMDALKHVKTKRDAKGLCSLIWSKNPAVLYPECSVKTVSNQRALASYYIYKQQTLDSIAYYAIFKLSFLCFDRFYKIEYMAPAKDNIPDALDALGRIDMTDVYSFVCFK